MSEFETRLLRLIALSVLTLGSVGLCIADQRVRSPIGAVALLCLAVLAGRLLVDFAKWLWVVHFKVHWTNEWRRQLAAPARPERDPSRAS